MRFASVVRLTKLFDTKDVDMPLQLLQRIVLDAVPHTDRIRGIGARKSLMKTAEAATTARHGPLRVIAGKQRVMVKGLKKQAKYNQKEGVIQDWSISKHRYIVKMACGPALAISAANLDLPGSASWKLFSRNRFW